jgi:hypothetical protein
VIFATFCSSPIQFYGLISLLPASLEFKSSACFTKGMAILDWKMDFFTEGSKGSKGIHFTPQKPTAARPTGEL